MDDWLSRFDTLFGSFSEPVLVAFSGNTAYFNTSAAHLFCNPPLAVGAPLPAVFSGLFSADDEGTLRVCPNFMISGTPYHLSISPVPDGFLIILRPSADRPLRTAPRPEVLAGRLRAPLNTLISATSLLSPAIEATAHPDSLRYLSIINQQQYRLLRILGNLSDSVALYAPERDAEAPFENTDLVAFLRNLAEMADGLAGLSGHAVLFSSAEDRLITAITRSQIERLLLHLISNALKFSPAGGTVRISLSTENNQAIFTVSDAGEGLTPGELATAFSPFEAVPEPTAKPKGLGLGLALALQIAVRHGGTVLLESGPERGTTVIVSLPVARQNDDTLHAYRPPTDYSGGFSTLLVELSDALPPEAFLPQNLE